MVDKVKALPVNAAIKNMLDTLHKGESVSPICALYDALVYTSHGMTADHASLFAERVYEVRLDAWTKSNPFLKTGKNKEEPKKRRADATQIRDVLSLTTLPKEPREKLWKHLCGLTAAYGNRAAVAGLIVTYHGKQGKMPANEWVERAVRAQLASKKGNGKNKKTVITKASVYMQRVIDACGRMTENYAGQHKVEVALMLRTAKATQKLCVVAEEKAAAAAKAAKASD